MNFITVNLIRFSNVHPFFSLQICGPSTKLPPLRTLPGRGTFLTSPSTEITRGISRSCESWL